MAGITINLAHANDQELSDLVFRFESEVASIENLQLFSGFTGGETRRIRNNFLAVYRLYEEAHYQYTIGNLDPDVWAGWESNIAIIVNGIGGRLWPALSPRYSEDFRIFMDGLIEAS